MFQKKIQEFDNKNFNLNEPNYLNEFSYSKRNTSTDRQNSKKNNLETNSQIARTRTFIVNKLKNYSHTQAQSMSTNIMTRTLLSIELLQPIDKAYIEMTSSLMVSTGFLLPSENIRHGSVGKKCYDIIENSITLNSSKIYLGLNPFNVKDDFAIVPKLLSLNESSFYMSLSLKSGLVSKCLGMITPLGNLVSRIINSISVSMILPNIIILISSKIIRGILIESNHNIESHFHSSNSKSSAEEYYNIFCNSTDFIKEATLLDILKLELIESSQQQIIIIDDSIQNVPRNYGCDIKKILPDSRRSRPEEKKNTTSRDYGCDLKEVKQHLYQQTQQTKREKKGNSHHYGCDIKKEYPKECIRKTEVSKKESNNSRNYGCDIENRRHPYLKSEISTITMT